MKRLPECVKRRIVEHLACYRTHAEVVDLIAEEFEIHVPTRHVRAYDPTSFQFAGRDDWVEYFGVVRRRFETQLGDVAIAQRAYRLRALQQAHERLLGDMMNANPNERVDLSREVRAILEQAAKEVGGVLTNVSKSESTSVVANFPVTIEEKRNMLALRIAEAMQKVLPAPDLV